MDEPVTKYSKLEKTIQRQSGEFEAFSKEWRDEAKDLYDFRAGEQWDTEDKAIMEEQMRPMITFNRMGPFIDAVIGLEIQNRQEVRYIPRKMNDTGINDLLTNAAEWVRDLCHAPSEESDAFGDLVLTGMGWTNTRIDFDDDPSGRIVIERLDPLSMQWDPHARKKNISDARWVRYDKRMSLEEIREKWPDAEFLAESPMEPMEEHDASNAWKYETDQAPETGRASKIVSEYQYSKQERMFKVATPNGMKELSQSDWNDIKQNEMAKTMLEDGRLRAVPFMKKVYRRAFLAGGKVLEDEMHPSQEGFTFRCMTGKRDRNTNTWYGLGRPLRDPQKWTNKFLSTILHHIATNGKGIMAEITAFDNPQKAEDEWAQPDAIKWMRDGAISQNKVGPVPNSTLPPDLHNLMQFSVQSFNNVAGMSVEMLGLTDRQQPGVLEMQRKQAGLAILAWCFDSLKLYREQQGRILADFIANYISDGRMVRVVGKEGMQYVPLLKDAMTLDYDVIVDDAPSSPNMKERVMHVLMQFLPILMQNKIPVPPEIIDYMPLPESLAMSWKKMLQPSPEQQQAKQMDMRQQAAKAGKDESVIELNKARAQATMANASNQQQAAAEKSRATTEKSNLETARLEIDAARVQNDSERVDVEKKRANTEAITSVHKLMNDTHKLINDARKK